MLSSSARPLSIKDHSVPGSIPVKRTGPWFGTPLQGDAIAEPFPGHCDPPRTRGNGVDAVRGTTYNFVPSGGGEPRVLDRCAHAPAWRSTCVPIVHVHYQGS